MYVQPLFPIPMTSLQNKLSVSVCRLLYFTVLLYNLYICPWLTVLLYVTFYWAIQSILVLYTHTCKSVAKADLVQWLIGCGGREGVSWTNMAWVGKPHGTASCSRSGEPPTPSNTHCITFSHRNWMSGKSTTTRETMRLILYIEQRAWAELGGCPIFIGEGRHTFARGLIPERPNDLLEGFIRRGW